MISITDIDKGITSSFDGTIKRVLDKRGHAEHMANTGQMLSEHIRAVVNINVTINKMDSEEYGKLEKIFLTGNKMLDIIDSDKGVEYNEYYIQGNTISLDEKEDYDTKKYYYTGTLNLNKR